MTTSWRRVSPVLLSLLVPLAACSDDQVDFPDGSSGAGGTQADAAADISNPDTSTGGGGNGGSGGAGGSAGEGGSAGNPPADARDTSFDACCGPDIRRDVAPDSNGEDGLPPDAPEPDGQFDDATADGSDDATSEDAATCESHCASGVCDINGDCKPCVKDDECTGGRVCNAGTCGARCGDGGAACAGNLVCCNEHCVDTTRDPAHCGACTTTCSETQFCGNAGAPVCKENILANVCNTKRATFLLDGLSDDDGASNVLKTAISTLCVPAPTSTSVLQTVSTSVNNTTGQPLVGGGELLVSAGGDSWQNMVRYLETSRTSPVYNETDGVTQLQWKHRGGLADGGDSVLQTIPLSMVTANHDYFLIEVVKDPISGSFSLVVYGIESPGTKAGAFYFANTMLPSIVSDAATTFTQAWYIVEWTASDSGTSPGAGDTFTILNSGM
jgi:hypothetical protein